MNDIAAFFVVLFLFISGFVSVSTRICDNVNRRIDKQNINLAGKAIAEYAENYEDDIIINESEYMSDLVTLTKNAVVGGIFVYDNNIKGIDSKGNCFINISTKTMAEDNIILLINNIMYELIPQDSPLAAINIANAEEYVRSYMFNNIEGTTAFVITSQERNGEYTYNVAGYRLTTGKSK